MRRGFDTLRRTFNLKSSKINSSIIVFNIYGVCVCECWDLLHCDTSKSLIEKVNQ